MMRDFDLAWTEPGEARISPVSCLLRSLQLRRTGTDEKLAHIQALKCGYTGGSEQNVLNANTPYYITRIVYES